MKCLLWINEFSRLDVLFKIKAEESNKNICRSLRSKVAHGLQIFSFSSILWLFNLDCMFFIETVNFGDSEISTVGIDPLG